MSNYDVHLLVLVQTLELSDHQMWSNQIPFHCLTPEKDGILNLICVLKLSRT